MDAQLLQERFASERSLLERLMKKIPGFKGYIDYTERCDSDRIVRGFAAEKVLVIKERIRIQMDVMVRGGNISELPLLESTDIRIEKLYRDITSAEPFVVSTFSHNRPRIAEEEYAKAIVLDDTIIAQIDTMIELIDSIGSDAEKILREMQKSIASVETVLLERKRILWGV